MVEVDQHHPEHCIYIAAASKLVPSSICYPHEMVRTRLQAAYEGEPTYIIPSSRHYLKFGPRKDRTACMVDWVLMSLELCPIVRACFSLTSLLSL